MNALSDPLFPESEAQAVVPVLGHDHNLPLQVHTIGRRAVSGDRPASVAASPAGRTIENFCFLHVTAGHGTFESGATGVREVAAGDAVLVFPDRWHRYGPATAGEWFESFFYCDGPLVRGCCEIGYLDPENPIVHLGRNGDMDRLFEQLLEAAAHPGPGRQCWLAGVGAHILGRFMAAAMDTESGHDRDAVLDVAVRRIHDALREPLDYPALAAELGMSYSTFRRRFRDYTGMSPHQYHLRQRLRWARELLVHEGLCVKQAAAATGFTDPDYFSRLFFSKLEARPSDCMREFAESATTPPQD